MKLTAEEIRKEYLSGTFHSERLLQLVKMKLFPPDLLADLATSDPYAFLSENAHWRARKVARAHPNLPAEVIQKYITWGSIHSEALYVISDVLENPSITTAMFNEMIKLPTIDWLEHQKLQGYPDNPTALPSTEERMGRILASIVHHPNCPLPVLIMAVKSTDPWIRMRASMSPNLSLAQIKKLLKDPDAVVRLTVVRNKKNPVSSLMSLLEPLPAGGKHKGGQYKIIQTLVRRLSKGSPERAKALAFLVSFNQGQATRVLVAKDTKDAIEIGIKAMDKSLAVRKVAVKNPAALPEHKVASVLLGDSNTNVIMVKKV